jgi:hypothetical protein
MQGSYTWSKDESDLTASAANSNDPGNLAQQYGPVAFSRPQRFIINYSYNLPFGMHQGFAGKMLSGWNISGVTTIQDGTPMTVTDTRNGTIYGVGANGVQRAGMCPGATYQSAQTSGGVESRLGGISGGPGYFNASSFCEAPAIGNGTDWGNAGVGIITGPGQFNFDTSLIKDTRIFENHSIQFRAEFFNLFNHPQFGNPATAVSTPTTFGQITTTTVNPRIMQFALKYTF